MDTSDLLRTNPVLAIHKAQDVEGSAHSWARGPVLDRVATKLAARGQRLPESSVAAWESEGKLSASAAREVAGMGQPGVCGLVVGIEEACVVPLTARESTSWSVENARLPLVPSRLTRILVDLLGRAGQLDPGVVPEARAFVLDSEFTRSCWGTSMDMAGVLAICRHVAGNPRCLDRTCAVIEPDGDSLQPVSAIEAKLAAFVREHGRGTLLIRHPDCGAAASFDAHFDEVWEVASLADLAERLTQRGWLTSWRAPHALGVAAVEIVATRVRELGQDFRRIVDLARRVLESRWSEEVPGAMRSRHQLDLLRSLRHLGRYHEALESAEQWRAQVRDAGDASWEQQLAEADLEVAACLFDMVEFERMLRELAPHIAAIDAEPLRYAPGLRVKIWNTAARAMVRHDVMGWQELFDRSLELQRVTDPSSVARTQNYLIEGLLRDGQLDRAAELIHAVLGAAPDSFSRSMCAFYRADLARRSGETWVDVASEAAAASPEEANHALGFYWLATARQRSREADDAAMRYQQAARCFELDMASSDAPNVLHVLAACAHLAASFVRGSTQERDPSELQRALQLPGCEALAGRIGGAPTDAASMERVFDALPWL